MIPRNAEPTSHRPVYQRIGRTEPARTAQRDLPEQPLSYSPTEAERVWRLLRQSAEGCNAASQPEVDTTGWDAA
ncbi:MULTISPECIES: hypothetical protein [unclassified Bradyrhizobium]|uniref:hypothetical protein n=1 Tax=unclassified Bradyrhizobium TaxID=2631580 RepID=UPI00247A6A8D|nr:MULTISPECIES: hypothetical protein [unclassified Bradyrhizobium]WGR74327.1 hypothetical protein MTX24_16515 [Bradyrhizobium sp. ISRA426]WGR79162.1 hypothetical protein MTX21_01630 [Bradyrhizobium sp. ISRA430]WGR90583.1 hypothetical protein MTX25_39775 [Bradyrhizobium sp. ISRA432]